MVQESCVRPRVKLVTPNKVGIHAKPRFRLRGKTVSQKRVDKKRMHEWQMLAQGPTARGRREGRELCLAMDDNAGGCAGVLDADLGAGDGSPPRGFFFQGAISRVNAARAKQRPHHVE